MPWFVLSVFETSVLSARTRLLSLVGPWLWKVRECSNVSATVMFCWPSAFVFEDAISVVGGLWEVEGLDVQRC